MPAFSRYANKRETRFGGSTPKSESIRKLDKLDSRIERDAEYSKATTAIS